MLILTRKNEEETWYKRTEVQLKIFCFSVRNQYVYVISETIATEAFIC